MPGNEVSKSWSYYTLANAPAPNDRHATPHPSRQILQPLPGPDCFVPRARDRDVWRILSCKRRPAWSLPRLSSASKVSKQASSDQTSPSIQPTETHSRRPQQPGDHLEHLPAVHHIDALTRYHPRQQQRQNGIDTRSQQQSGTTHGRSRQRGDAESVFDTQPSARVPQPRRAMVEVGRVLLQQLCRGMLVLLVLVFWTEPVDGFDLLGRLVQECGDGLLVDADGEFLDELRTKVCLC